MPTETLNESQMCQYQRVLFYNNSGSPQGQLTSYDKRIDTRTLVKNPGRLDFFKVNGYLPVSDYDRTIYERQLTMGSHDYQGLLYTFNGKAGRDTFRHTNTNYVSHFDNDTPTQTIENSNFLGLESSAIAGMNSEVREQSVSVFETVFEGKQTLQLIVDTAARIAKSARAARRGDMTGAASHLGVSWTKKTPQGGFSDRWLALRYGWTPLCSEVYGAMEWTYNAMKLYPGMVRHAEGKAKKHFRGVNPATRRYGYGTSYPYAGAVSYGTNVTYDVLSSEEVDLKVLAFCVYRITNPTLAASTGLGLTNPLLVGWELLPLSFVADWFVNVSDVLGQLDAWVGRQYLDGGLTRTLQTTRTATSKYVSIQSGMVQGAFQPATSRRRMMQVRRRRFTNPPIVYPQYYAQVNWKRALDAASLVRQAFR